MNIILFDTPSRTKLLPLTATKAVADLRMGILTIKERWARVTTSNIFVLTDLYLQHLYKIPAAGEYIFIDARIIPNPDLAVTIKDLGENEAIKDENGLMAGRAFIEVLPPISNISFLFKKTNFTPAAVKRFSLPFHLFQWNAEMIEFDFRLISEARTSNTENSRAILTNPDQIFIEEGAAIEHCVLNASTGPIYIGKNATVMEGCFIRGPFAVCEGAVVKMGAKIYGATTIGCYSAAGGEIKNSIISDYSNKAHDGYLGDSVVGKWCNLGAGTTNSNLKNTAGTISLWNDESKSFSPVGNKCGVIMGDYSRTAINTSLNTGTVIGTCCNVFGEGLLPSFIPSFSWGAKPPIAYIFDKAIRDIDNWKKLKNKTISEPETQILKHIFDQTNNNAGI